MKYKQNLHTHTTYSDGKDTPEEMILEAIQRGFQGIGFSEHTFNARSSYAMQMKMENVPVYREEIRHLKEKYKGVIDVFCGLEYEMLSTFSPEGFDYLIGSAHYIICGDKIVGVDRDLKTTLVCIEEKFGGDGLRYAKAYYETLARLPEINDFDIVAHFDLVAKNNEKGNFMDTASKEYLDLAFGAIHALQGKIPLFEISTAPMIRGYRTCPYPQIEILKEFKRCGFGAVISSDCHDKNVIDSYFKEAEELLFAAGFRSKYILTDNGFQEVTL